MRLGIQNRVNPRVVYDQRGPKKITKNILYEYAISFTIFIRFRYYSDFVIGQFFKGHPVCLIKVEKYCVNYAIIAFILIILIIIIV